MPVTTCQISVTRCLFAVTVCAALLVAAATAAAQDVGSVSGVVFDQDGNVVPGATVRITGEPMPAGRTTTTGETGMYQFRALLPGNYQVTAEKTGLGTVTRALEVNVGNDTQVDLAIGLAVTASVEVVAAATPVVDLRSSEVSFNYKASQIEALPLQKSYTALFQLIPGVADNNSFAPSGGASRQDNKYLMDGVDITNPGFGYLSTEVNGLDIAEFNVKRGAISAEFGRATGFVTNAVSRSGTNAFHGILNADLRPKQFSGGSNSLNTAGQVVEIPSTIDRYSAGGNAGGPLLKDRLFWYGSGLGAHSLTSGRTNALGAVPDSPVTTF
jgi:hypothetical protein